MNVHVFIGPTLPADTVRERFPAAVLHGPARHGDLIRLDPGPGDTAVIIDGLYHHSLPLRHEEILWALARGTAVIGAASIGALRAAEFDAYGMTGAGEIYRQYRDGDIDSDADVAVTHTEEPPHRPLTLALVDLRHQLTRFTADGTLTPDAAEQILRTGTALPYTRRSWAAIRHHLARTAPRSAGQAETAARLVAKDPLAHSLKARDALTALELAHTRLGTPPATPPRNWTGDPGWRTTFFDETVTDFLPADPDGPGTVTLGDVLREQRLHDPDFPRRWAAFVAARIDGPRPTRLTTEQRTAWLTPREAELLDDEQALATALTRATRPPLAPPAERDRLHALLGRSAGPHPAAPAPAAREGRHWTRRDARLHLHTVWNVPEDDRAALLARARDRGFPDVPAAVDAALALLRRPHPAPTGAGETT
ncbi:TfuA-like protein [Streptomyces sp. NPDC035033]|uniref:TfuA-like protein n=1 Tax=Streptomyces sp. NPDC035033 TaxID=3155368 RepID=UPI0033D3336B